METERRGRRITEWIGELSWNCCLTFCDFCSIVSCLFSCLLSKEDGSVELGWRFTVCSLGF